MTSFLFIFTENIAVYTPAYCFVLCCSLRENYGRVLSLKLGSYKFVMASNPEAIKEMLVKKSADYSGRPQTYSVLAATLGRLPWSLEGHGMFPCWMSGDIFAYFTHL